MGCRLTYAVPKNPEETTLNTIVTASASINQILGLHHFWKSKKEEWAAVMRRWKFQLL